MSSLPRPGDQRVWPNKASAPRIAHDFANATPAAEDAVILPFPRRPDAVSWRRHFLFLGLPAIVLVIGSLFFCLTNADIEISGWFFPWGWEEPWTTIKYASSWPVVVLGVVGLIVAAGGVFWTRLRPVGNLGLFNCLVLVLGPVLLINVVFKDNWGRPRPSEIREFGGRSEFSQVWQPGPVTKNSSFPSGHAAIGFALMAPAFVLYRTRPRLAAAVLLVGLAWGMTIGAARVIQGGHFPSDVLWSAGMIYLTALFVDWGQRTIRRRCARGRPRRTQRGTRNPRS